MAFACAWKSGFTILELLICVTVTSILIAILLPALGAARESARRIQCNNHLKQLGLSLHAYHEVHRSLPPGWRWDAHQKTAFGWLPPILPYLGEYSLWESLDFNSPVDGSGNEQVRQRTLPLFLCPSDMAERTFMLYAESDEFSEDAPLFRLPAANYLGVFGIHEPDDVWKVRAGVGVFSGERAIRFQEITRGLSNVLLLGERRASTIPSTWLGIDSRGEDAHCRILGNANLGPNARNADECEFTSRHPGVVNFLWADGHVKAIADTIDAHLYRQLASRSEICD